MIDVCLITDGGWPCRRNGLASWVQNLMLACDELSFAVLSQSRQAQSARFAFPPNLQRLEFRQGGFSSPPRSRRYVAAGSVAARFLTDNPQLATQTLYVEHGDGVKEAALGLVMENGRRGPHGSNERAARAIALERDEICRRAALTVGVCDRTRRRLIGQGISSVTISNAVPPSPPTRQCPNLKWGYIGRFCRSKGADRIATLEAISGVSARVIGPRDSADDVERPDAEELAVLPFNQLRCLVMPSRTEASPFVALEAEAAGVPVLVSEAAEIDSSRLIRQRRFEPNNWCEWLQQPPPLDPAYGHSRAAKRWATFAQRWSRTLRGEPS